MKNKLKVIIAIAMVAIMSMSASAVALEESVIDTDSAQMANTRASTLLTYTAARASRFNAYTLRLSFEAKAYQQLSVLGVQNVAIFDVTAGTSRTYSGFYSQNTSNYNSYFDISGLSGHQYYAQVSFYAQDSNGRYEYITEQTGIVTL